jgi:hypothetical protein
MNGCATGKLALILAKLGEHTMSAKRPPTDVVRCQRPHVCQSATLQEVTSIGNEHVEERQATVLAEMYLDYVRQRPARAPAVVECCGKLWQA